MFAPGHGYARSTESDFPGSSQPFVPHRSMGLVLVIGLISMFGCASCPLPRIDPTGQGLFLPRPYSTTLSDTILHRDANGQPTGGIFPQSAFPTPPAPPACLSGATTPAPAIKTIGTGLSKHHQDTGDRGQLLLTPTRIVAPVNGDVVLMAGICGEDGYLVTREPIEWMLAPDSVGTFLEVGDDAKGKPLRSWHAKPKVEKLDVDFAKGRTSSMETRITRGSEKCTDDLILKKGQTWISLTSPTEGVSRVTAFASDSKIWDRRRQTATIYWVDAEWQFPPAQDLKNNEVAILRTRVTRADGFVGAEGWEVHYRTLNPEVARFAPNGSDAYVAMVDKDGFAEARLQNVSGGSGTAILAISVIRPAIGSENMPALPLGNGQTIVSWTAPRLQLQAAGPPTGLPDQVLTYSASIANAGEREAENARLSVELPQGMQVLDVTPQPDSSTTSGAIWNIPSLPARQQLDVVIRAKALSQNDYRLLFRAEAPGLQPEVRDVNTRISQPQVSLNMVPADNLRQAEVNQVVLFNVDVVNSGNQTITDLELTATSDAGLQHAQQGNNSVGRRIPVINPGQSIPIGLEFVVRKEGELGVNLVASSGGVKLNETRAFITGVAPAPKVPRVEVVVQPLDGLTQLAMNASTTVGAIVRNVGQTPLTNLVVTMTYDAALYPTKADSNVRDMRTSNPPALVWQIPELPVGKNITFRAEIKGIAPANQAVIRVDVVTAEQPSATNSFAFSVGNVGQPGEVLPGQGFNSQLRNKPLPDTELNLESSRGWSIRITPSKELVRVGEEIKYTITARNEQGQEDQQAILEVRYPPDVSIVSFSSIGANLKHQYLDGGIRVEPIAFSRSNETFEWTLVVRPKREQTVTIAAAVTSIRQPKAQPQQITTQVLGR